MPHRVLIAFCAVCGLAAVSGCRDFSVPTAADPDERMAADIAAELDTPFRLAPGQEARVEDRGITVAFEQVLADTRCTDDASCDEPGDARILTEVRRDGGSRFHIVLTVPGGVDTYYHFGNVVQDGEERFRLLRLEPYPAAGDPIDPGVYRAFLVIQSF